VLVGQNVTLGVDDDARAQAEGALRLVLEALAEEMAEQGIVEEGVARPFHFLAGEDAHHGRRSPAYRIAVGGGFVTGAGPGRRCCLVQLDRDRGLARQPFRLERSNDEQEGEADGGRLRKGQPESVHRVRVLAFVTR